MSDADEPRADKPADPPGHPPRPWRQPDSSPPLGPAAGTTLDRALLAAAVWGALLGFLLVIGVVRGASPGGKVIGALMVLTGGLIWLAALFTWWFTRKRHRPFWQLVLIALPMFLVAFVLVDKILANAGRNGL